MGCGASSQQNSTVPTLEPLEIPPVTPLTNSSRTDATPDSQLQILLGVDVSALVRRRDANQVPPTMSPAELAKLRALHEHLRVVIEEDRSSSAELEVIRNAWTSIDEKNATCFYGQRIFEKLAKEKPESIGEALASADLVMLGSAVISTIRECVFKVNQPDVLVPMLISLGSRHTQYGMKPADLEHMGIAATQLLREELRQEFDRKVEAEWLRIWNVIRSLMTRGWMTGNAQHENKPRSFDEACIRTVEATWSRLWSCSRQRGLPFFGSMPQFCPVMEKYSDAIHSVRKPAHRMDIFLNNIVLHLREKKRIDSALKALGAQHVFFGVSPSDFTECEDGFIENAANILSPGTISQVECMRMRHLYQMLTEKMIEGMTDGINDKHNQVAPRDGPLAIVTTDVEGSAKLWASDRLLMGAAIEWHNRIIRGIVREFGGYEVKNVGDSFVVAHQDIWSATLIALKIQTEMLRCGPAAQGFKISSPKEGSGPSHCWDDTTLRIRIGVEFAHNVEPKFDPLRKRFDYCGPSVKRCAAIASLACGGQILMTRQTFNTLKVHKYYNEEPRVPSLLATDLCGCEVTTDAPLASCVHVPQGETEVQLRGLSETCSLIQILPGALKERTFPPLQKI